MMKKSKTGIRTMCLILALGTLFSATPALADVISSNGKYIQTYNTKDADDPTNAQVRIKDEESTLEDGGWYYIPYRREYVRASDVQRVDATPTPTPSPSPTPTLKPGETAAPTPTPTPKSEIEALPDSSYDGTVISYLVPAGGLNLYNKQGGETSVIVPAGTTIKLNTDASKPGWYSTYYNSNTYYVPESLTSYSPTETLAPSNIKSVTVSATTSLYTAYNTSKHELTGITSNTLTAGSRVNVTHIQTFQEGGVTHDIYSYKVGDVTYYFDGSGMSKSSGTVVGGEDVTMVLRVSVKEGTKLYRTQDKKAKDFYKIPSGQTLLGQKLSDSWYRVEYNGEYFYVAIGDEDTTETVVVGGDQPAASANTFRITAGSSGAYIYTSRTTSKTHPYGGEPSARLTSKSIAAGQSVVVGTYDSNWYTYVLTNDQGVDTVYYLYRGEFEDSVSTDKLGSMKIFLDETTGLFDRMTATKPTAIKLAAGYYVVQSIDSKWYSIVYDSKTYYIKKDADAEKTVVITIKGDMNIQPPISGFAATDTAQVKATIVDNSGVSTYMFYYKSDSPYYLAISDYGAGAVDSSQTPIGTTGENKSYTVVIGVGGGKLYLDADCIKPAPFQLDPGSSVAVTKYTAWLYLVEQSGAKYYLPVAYVASVKGGDDASVVSPNQNEEPITEVVGGEINTSFAGEVVACKAPRGGLWLYKAMSTSSQAISIAEGVSIRLNAVDADWYTTWYSGQQYYVPKKSLVVQDSMSNTTDMYSITLNNAAELYTTQGLTAKANPTITLPAATRVNVRVGGKDTSGNIISYAYVHTNGKTYYIRKADIVANSMIGATLASNTDTQLITSFKLAAGKSVWAYSKPDTTSSSVKIEQKNVDTLFGVYYNADWYKIVYDNAVWYLKKGANNIDWNNVEQITVSSGAATTTFTVVINVNGAKLYTQPKTNVSASTVGGQVYGAGMLNYANRDLAAGSTVQASKYDSTWYTYATGGETLYFMNTTVSNATSNESIRSYQITITNTGLAAAGFTDGLRLYTTVSGTATPIGSLKLTAGTYNLRKVDATWSSVVIKNVTYYVRNADIPKDDMDGSFPIASTSVGKTYTIIVGSNTKVYPGDKLTGTPFATLSGGFKTKGLKTHVSGANPAEAPDELVYKIEYSGRTGYIAARNVTGILEGDEVEEAKQAEQNQNNGYESEIPVGTSSIETLPAGTKLYTAKSLTSTYVTLPAQVPMTVKKDDASWYVVTYNSAPHYIPIEIIEPDAAQGGGTNERVVLEVGESYTYTFTSGTPCYTKPENGLPIAELITKGSVLSIKKVSEDWYEVTVDGTKYYVKVSDVVLPFIQKPTTPTNPTDPNTGTTDSSGAYITAQLQINPPSGSVNLRKEANSTSTILARIPKGTNVKNNSYVKDSSNVIWYNVTFGTKTGYVRGDLTLPVGTGTSAGGVDPSQDIGKSLLVNIATVNVRSGAGTNFSVVGNLAKNQAVVPTDYAVGSDNLVWYKFQYNSSTVAYIRSDYLAGSAANTSQQSGNVAVKAGGTNMRSGPGESFPVVVKLDRDIIVTILGNSTDSNETLWYRVTIDGKSGYVRHDLVRALTSQEQGSLQNELVSQYTELKSGSKGPEVVALQQQLINLGYLASGSADGNYGPKTIAAVKAYQTAKGLTANGIASQGMQSMLFNTTAITPGTTQKLDWYSTGNALINSNKSIQVFDINSQVTWNATYINGSNHADVVPATKADADKLKANGIIGDYVRRPVIVTIAGQKYAGSMYAVGHGEKNYVSFFSGVMCIHFTGSKTHGTDKVDKDHQNAIDQAYNYANTQ